MKKIITITSGIVLFFLVILGITFLESLKSQNVPANNKSPVPTLVESQRDSQTKPIRYDQNGTSKILNTMKSRPTPAITTDKTIRESMISPLNGKSGKIYYSDLYQIDYTEGPDIFEVKILKGEPNESKSNAISFFLGKGLTEDGICKLPVIFYLDFEMLKNRNVAEPQFNPVPDFCL